ncbi:MAG TPA: PEP-utilizing enzyme [Candidatus Saccharimonadales bacterium]|nr:PEP-utilizing enzyme [Candidatus Saccharimonadales bacterium]
MKNLFKSQTAYEILELLSGSEKSTEPKLYLGEISAALNKNNANVSRELAGLIEEGVVSQETRGKKKYYFLNQNYKAITELKSLLAKNNNQNLEKMFKHDWLLAEEIINISPWFMAIPFYCFTNGFTEPGGRAYKQMTGIYKGYNLCFYFDKQDAHEVGEHLVDKFLGDIDFMEDVNTKIRFYADKLNETVLKIPESGLEKLRVTELWRYYQEHEDIHLDYYRYGWIPVAADMFGDNLTNRGKSILKDFGVVSDKIEEYMALLTQPDKDSLLKEEQDNLTQIGIMVQRNPEQLAIFKELFRKFKEEDVKFFGLYTHSEEYEAKFSEVVRELKDKIAPKIMEHLENHYHKYFYTKFIYTEEQGVYAFEHYLKELVRLVSGDADLAGSFAEHEQHTKITLQGRADLIKKLKLTADIQRFFSAWGDFMVTKIYRRYAQLFALYKTTFILEEIADRVGVTLKELRFMKSSEIKKALFDGQIDKTEVKKRVEFCVYYTAKDTELFFSGEEANNIASKYIQKQEDVSVSELKGQCGCRGQARGTVRIVNVIADMAKMKAGDILVSISTQPDLVPAMKKAAAFVTDQGGVTSHAAIVAREMRKPCVIATKIATKALHDGDIVEVDADKGLVKVISRA